MRASVRLAIASLAARVIVIHLPQTLIRGRAPSSLSTLITISNTHRLILPSMTTMPLLFLTQPVTPAELNARDQRWRLAREKAHARLMFADDATLVGSVARFYAAQQAPSARNRSNPFRRPARTRTAGSTFSTESDTTWARGSQETWVRGRPRPAIQQGVGEWEWEEPTPQQQQQEHQAWSGVSRAPSLSTPSVRERAARAPRPNTAGGTPGSLSNAGSIREAQRQRNSGTKLRGVRRAWRKCINAVRVA